MSKFIAFIFSSTFWSYLAAGLAGIANVLPHAAAGLNSASVAIGSAAAHGDVTGAATAAMGAVGAAITAAGMHLYEHGKAHADSNAKPQSGAAPNEG